MRLAGERLVPMGAGAAWRAAIVRCALFLGLAGVVLAASQAGRLWTPVERPARDPLLRVRSVADAAEESRELIDFLEERVRRDPSDSVGYSKLAGLYLQRLRETGALGDLALAQTAARKSLAGVPAVRNVEGLAALELAEFAAHQFSRARDDARRLIALDGTPAPYAMLGDTLAELGDYSQAWQAYGAMQKRSLGTDENVATRLARSAQLRGDNAGAIAHFSTALSIELSRSEPSRERVAWFEWQLGDTAFFSGDSERAERSYADALRAYPGYFRALASLGRLHAARAQYSQAIGEYQAAIATLPDPTFVAELGDIYRLSGNRKSAAVEYELVDLIGHLSKLNGVMYNRQVATFYADHDLKSREAYLDAKREYAVRRDILGADVLAWTALKAGKLAEAQTAMHAALRLGTQDPRLFYHAGMIALANGHRAAAHGYLERALALNPHFDPLQATGARKALERVDSEGGARDRVGTERRPGTRPSV